MGNFVIYPQDVGTAPPRGLIHFLGGAFVGAAPHLTYRYLLDSLCDQGFIVVTTPYGLEFDYLKACRGVLSKFDLVRAELAKEFGALPLIGIGHSCGALLQSLISSEFPEAPPRAANVLISFNNKPVKEAIPGFEETVVPISELVMGTSNPSQAANAASARDAIAQVRTVFDSVLDGFSASGVAPPVVTDELVPAVKQSLAVVDQVPGILAEIAAGTKEFTPTPTETRKLLGANYRANRTFIIQFENDAIDESPEIEGILRNAAVTLLASTNSSAHMEVDLKQLTGTHVTPLTQNIILEPPPLQWEGQAVQDPLSPVRQQVRENFLQTVNEVKTLIVQWLAL